MYLLSEGFFDAPSNLEMLLHKVNIIFDMIL